MFVQLQKFNLGTCLIGGDMRKGNKIVHSDNMGLFKGDTKGMYASFGWKLDTEKCDSDIPRDECEKVIADGEIEFD